MSENFALPFFFCAYFCGAHDPRVPGEKEKLNGMLPLQEYVRIKESQFLIVSGNLLGPGGLVHFIFYMMKNFLGLFPGVQDL